jgi:hypothetical protein
MFLSAPEVRPLPVREERLERDLSSLAIRPREVERVLQPGRGIDALDPCIIQRRSEGASFGRRHVGAIPRARVVRAAGPAPLPRVPRRLLSTEQLTNGRRQRGEVGLAPALLDEPGV